MKRKSPARRTQASLIELESSATIVGAAPLHRKMIDLLALDKPLHVDASRVEEIDTAILQLLVSLWRTSRERGIACTWLDVSAPLRRAAKLIGVAGMLQLPDVDDASGGTRAA